MILWRQTIWKSKYVTLKKLWYCISLLKSLKLLQCKLNHFKYFSISEKLVTLTVFKNITYLRMLVLILATFFLAGLIQLAGDIYGGMAHVIMLVTVLSPMIYFANPSSSSMLSSISWKIIERISWSGTLFVVLIMRRNSL